MNVSMKHRKYRKRVAIPAACFLKLVPDVCPPLPSGSDTQTRGCQSHWLLPAARRATSEQSRYLKRRKYVNVAASGNQFKVDGD